MTSQMEKSTNPQTSMVELKKKEPLVRRKPFEFVPPPNIKGKVSVSTFVVGGSVKKRKKKKMEFLAIRKEVKAIIQIINKYTSLYY